MTAIVPSTQTTSPATAPVVHIGQLALRSYAMLAPMAGVCDSPFKRVVRHVDTDSLLSTELVNGEVWLKGHFEMAQRAVLHPSETPVALQLSGHDPHWLSEAAKKAEAEGADLIDINFGCPAPHLINSGNGAALLKDPAAVAPIFEAVRQAISVPLTVKMRIGWDETLMTGLEIAKIAEACGLDAVWVHGRTKVQGYTGKADWEAIKGFKQALKIPVIGNGDILTPQDAKEKLEFSGVDAVAIGRGAMGNPWIFRRANHYILTGELLPEPTLLERIETCRLQVRYLIEDMGEQLGVPETRKHVAWYVRGLPDTQSLRTGVNTARTHAEVETALDRYLEAQPDHAITARPELFGTLVDPKWMRYK
jgi:nifR3 family TIM-barrel protein